MSPFFTTIFALLFNTTSSCARDEEASSVTLKYKSESKRTSGEDDLSLPSTTCNTCTFVKSPIKVLSNAANSPFQSTAANVLHRSQETVDTALGTSLGEKLADFSKSSTVSALNAADLFSPTTLDELEFLSTGSTSRRHSKRSNNASRRQSLSSEDVSSGTSSSSSHLSASSPPKLTGSVKKSSIRLGENEFKQVNQYIIIKDLGRGVHAKVTLGLNTTNNHLYAIKTTNNNVAVAETAVRKEIAVLKKMNHENVLKLFEVIDDHSTHELLLILEYASNGPIFTRYNRVPLTEETLLAYMRDIIRGLDYLHHAVGIAHMDLKPENLLKSSDGKVKIADFGVSFIGQKSNISNAVKRLVGTPAFIAPEMLDDEGYDPYAADIWSLGICMFNMATAQLPFVGRTVFQIIATAKRQGLQFPAGLVLSSELKDLISAVVVIDPNQRASVTQIMSHQWMTSGGMNPLPSQLAHEKIIVSEEEVAAAVCQDPLALLLRPKFRTLHFNPGDIIMRKGEQGDTMYFINSGVCEVLMDGLAPEDASGEDKAILAVRTAGDYIGEMAVIQAIHKDTQEEAVGIRTASVRARGSVDCLSVTVDDILDALNKDTGGRERLFRTASFRLEQNEEIMLQLLETETRGDNVKTRFIPTRTIHVLYAEDSLPTQFIVKRLLKKLGGVEVTCVSDGKAALEHCTRCVDGKLQNPDIILMDCQMPLMNGLEATVAIRRLRDEKMSRVPIVAVSSGIKSMNKLACVEAGMDDYVAKPLNQETLASALMNNLPSELIKDDMNARIQTL